MSYYMSFFEKTKITTRNDFSSQSELVEYDVSPIAEESNQNENRLLILRDG